MFAARLGYFRKNSNYRHMHREKCHYWTYNNIKRNVDVVYDLNSLQPSARARIELLVVTSSVRLHDQVTGYSRMNFEYIISKFLTFQHITVILLSKIYRKKYPKIIIGKF